MSSGSRPAVPGECDSGKSVCARRSVIAIHLFACRDVRHLESGEALALGRNLGAHGDDLEHVEADSLGQWPALANNHLITLLHAERGAQVHRHVLVALLVALVFADVVQVVAADDDGALHLCAANSACQDTAADAYVAGERALLVDVVACRRERGGVSGNADQWALGLMSPAKQAGCGRPDSPTRCQPRRHASCRVCRAPQQLQLQDSP